MSDFNAAYPGYETTARLDELRATEYSYLDQGGHVYLDYTGSGLPARTQLHAHAARLRSGVYGNPHSDNPTSSAATMLVERARATVLRYFNASQDQYAVIFTPNATGACRLVGEAYPFGRRSRFVLTADNHNSVNGIREYAARGGARVAYVGLHGPGLRVTEPDMLAGIGRGHGSRPGLFAYPAQSNFSGVRHPLAWVARAQAAGYDVLLDAAAYVPTSRLDLSIVQPEFVAISWYKVFGFPTGVGCLLARHEALARLRRPWFAGGTIMGASVDGGWHQMLAGEAGFEDGTVNFLAIPDVTVGLDWISCVGIDLVHQRVGMLTSWLLDCLGRMRHSSGAPMVRVYGPPTGVGRGGTVALNFLDPDGRVVDERAVARDSSAAGISLRTGCFCNPGAGEAAFGLTRRDLRAAWRTLSRGQAEGTMERYLSLVGLPTGGAVRVSLGVASTLDDVEAFLDFAERTYRDRRPDLAGLRPRHGC
ncbi:MAG TPA: aminotransferase class V-fold PLP-dependent enzyme [Trebonia sp.]|jgi:selenocysteine lyase/cysteine desulfurase|nr:aminotransferase class V-fold PLP-dependent enzyme [Trebonia sp.]